MAKQTKTSALTLRFTDEELAMIDQTREYATRESTTVLGQRETSRTEAVKLLLRHGFKAVERALRKAATETTSEQADPATEEAGRTDPESPADPSPGRGSFAGLGR